MEVGTPKTLFRDDRGKRIALMVFGAGLFIPLIRFFFINSLDTVFERVVLAHGIFMAIVLVLSLAGLLYLKQVVTGLKGFFTASTHPLNLAVFRVVVFLLLFTMDISEVALFSRFPAVLCVPPAGLEFLIPYLPHHGEITFLIPIYKFICLMAAIGWLTPLSTPLGALMSFYLLLIPQFYGKIDHYHHLVWFALLLAVSPCGKVGSMDYFLRCFMRKVKSVASLNEPEPSMVYALPLRFGWVLIGILYFSAGYPKWWHSGLEWVFSQNLIHHMHYKWLEFAGWTPLWRIDHHPALSQFLSLGVILFECGFIFLVFSRTRRWWAVLGALLFHNMTYVFMRIGFMSLQLCYVAFFDWHHLFGRFKSYFMRTPTPAREQGKTPVNVRQIWPVVSVGALLLVGNFFCALTQIHSWPISAYPSFAYIFRSHEILKIDFEVIDRTGKPIPSEELTLIRRLRVPRFKGLIESIYLTRNADLRNEKFKALWRLCVEAQPGLVHVQSVQFYEYAYTLVPEDRALNPLHKTLLYEIGT